MHISNIQFYSKTEKVYVNPGMPGLDLSVSDYCGVAGNDGRNLRLKPRQTAYQRARRGCMSCTQAVNNLLCP